MSLENLGKIILLFAIILLLAGSLLFLVGRFLGIQRLPGDIEYKRDGVSFFFPLGTSILLSIVITIILNVLLFISKKP